MLPFQRTVRRYVNSAAHTVSGGGGPTWTFGAGVTNNSGVFTSITVGSGILVVSILEKSTTSSVAVSAVAFGATSLTKALDEPSSNPPWHSLWYGVVTGATATITITSAGGSIYECAISYGVLTNVTATPLPPQGAAASVTTTPNVTITVPSTGIAITSIASDRPLTGSWSGSTSNSATVLGGGTSETLLQAHSTATGSINPKFTGTNAWYSVVSAAWGP